MNIDIKKLSQVLAKKEFDNNHEFDEFDDLYYQASDHPLDFVLKEKYADELERLQKYYLSLIESYPEE